MKRAVLEYRCARFEYFLLYLDYAFDLASIDCTVIEILSSDQRQNIAHFVSRNSQIKIKQKRCEFFKVPVKMFQLIVAVDKSTCWIKTLGLCHTSYPWQVLVISLS
jgi:hypothetical protein